MTSVQSDVNGRIWMIKFPIYFKDLMNRKAEKRQSRSKGMERGKLTSPAQLRETKSIKPKKEQVKPRKRLQKKQSSNLQEPSSGTSLFTSLQELPKVKPQDEKTHKSKKITQKKTISSHNIEDSTASREFKQYLQYDCPNGEYFGSKISGFSNKPKSKVHSKSKEKSSSKKHHSLSQKIREYRRMSTSHRSESQSMKSELSEKEMHRLQKIQSIQKMRLMEEIMEIEEARLHLVPRKGR